MNQLLSDWNRLEAVIEWVNLNTNAFSREIGLSRAENLYQIKRGNNGISRKLADMIVNCYPEIDRTWLLTGGGDMFAHSDMRSAKVPLYEVNVEREVMNHNSLETSLSLITPPNVKADFAMVYQGQAMGEVTPVNSILFLHRIGVDEIIAGGEYVVVTDKFTLLRRVRTDEGQLRLEAIQRDRYDDIPINDSQITAVYHLTAKIIVCD